MPKTCVRIASVQMVLIFITVVLTGMALKGLYVPLPWHAFPMLVRNYGFLLLTIPVAWAVWAILKANRPTYDVRDQVIVTLSGIVLCVLVFP